MRTPKGIFFDFGNVLSHFDHKKTYQGLSKYCDMSITEMERNTKLKELKTNHDIGGITSDAFIDEYILAIGAAGLDHATFSYMWCDIFTENEQMLPLMEKLATQADIFLVSNTDPLHHLRYITDTVAVKKYIPNERQYVSYELRALKPDTSFFARALSRANLLPHDVCYIDDIPENIIAGKQIGMHSFQFDMRTNSIDELSTFFDSMGFR